MKRFTVDSLVVNILDTRDEMGLCAAKDIADTIRKLQLEKDEINMIFAAAPSQNETLLHLIEQDGIDWAKINAFHMDEYIGLESGSKASFGYYLDEHIFSKVNFKSVNYIDHTAKDINAEADRYTKLLEKYKTDIVIMGVGENGHIAFNDPGVADFNDEKFVKVAELDDICRNQQVNDGCFANISLVPKYALTLTVPALCRADYMFCSVPSATKAAAIKEMLTTKNIDEHCPATILRKHENAYLYCDLDSAMELKL